jgi:hypothetical protein
MNPRLHIGCCDFGLRNWQNAQLGRRAPAIEFDGPGAVWRKLEDASERNIDEIEIFRRIE